MSDIVEQWDVRYCPGCGSTSVAIEFDDPLLNGWCTISCKDCGRELSVERLDAPTWEDPQWVASGRRS